MIIKVAVDELFPYVKIVDDNSTIFDMTVSDVSPGWLVRFAQAHDAFWAMHDELRELVRPSKAPEVDSNEPDLIPLADNENGEETPR